MVARVRWVFIAFVIALAVACAIAANAQGYPPQTPFVSSLGGRGGSGPGAPAGTVTGAGASPQVAFWTGASTIGGDAGLTYDSATDILSVGVALRNGNGSVGTPSFSFSSAGNTDNGMYLPANDTLGFSAGGTLITQMTSTRVGIAGAPNTGQLHVQGGRPQIAAGGGGVDGNISLLNDAGSNIWSQDVVDLSSIGGSGDDGRFDLSNGMMYFFSGGGVGIAANAGIAMHTGGPSASIATTNERMKFNTSNSATPGVVFNEPGNNYDFRVESDTDANAINIDASAETMLLMGGSGSTGCSIDASGNLSCAGTVGGGGGAFLPLAGGTMTGAIVMNTGAGANLTIDEDSIDRAGDLTFNATGAGADFLANADGDFFLYAASDFGGLQVDGGAGSLLTIVSDETLIIEGGGGGGGQVVLTAAGLVGNDSGSSTGDFRWETDTDVNGIFLDASAETIDFVGGSSSTGCDVTSAGAMKCAAGFSAIGGNVNAIAGSLISSVQIVGGSAGVACAGGTLSYNPAATTTYVRIDANAAACVVTIGETNAVLNSDITFEIVTSAGAGAVTFVNVANVHAGPTLCTTTGLTLNGVYTVTYADKTDDMYLGKACTQN